MKTYIITYDDNIGKVGRVMKELVKIGLSDIKIINGINKKNIRWANIEDPDCRTISYIDGNRKSNKLTLSECSLMNTVVMNNVACMLSHKLAFEDAKANGYEKVIMVEDDLLLSYKAERYFEKILETVPEDRDMLRLEWNPPIFESNITKINDYWMKAKVLWSTAFMIFNKKAIDRILEVMNNGPIGSFDQLTNRQVNDLKSYASTWSIGIQYPLD